MDSVKRASHRESNQWEWFTLVQLWLLLPLSCIHFSDVIGPAFLVYYILLLPLSIDYLKSNYFSVQKLFLFCIFQSKICFPACLLWSALVSVFVFHCLCFLCLYFFPIKDCLLSIVLKYSRLLSVSVKRRHPASTSSPQNIRRPNLFAINNGARSAAAFVLCFCYIFYTFIFYIFYIFHFQPPKHPARRFICNQQFDQRPDMLLFFYIFLSFSSSILSYIVLYY